MCPKDVSEYFMKTFQDILDHREATNEKRNDIFQLLMQLKTKGFIDADNGENDTSES